MGPVAPRQVGSSQTRARTRVPCIGRQILKHCATRQALRYCILKAILFPPREGFRRQELFFKPFPSCKNILWVLWICSTDVTRLPLLPGWQTVMKRIIIIRRRRKYNLLTLSRALLCRSHALFHFYTWGNWGLEKLLLVQGHAIKKGKILKNKGVEIFQYDFLKNSAFNSLHIGSSESADLLPSTDIYWNPTVSHSKKDGEIRVPRLWFQHWIEACHV